MEKAQKGDLIRIVKSEDNRYENGVIFEVGERIPEDVGVLVVPRRMFVYDREYVIHRKAGEEDSDAKAEYPPGTAFSPNGLFQIEPRDTVNHPNHYTQGKFETIEVIEEITSGYNDGYVAYCVGNALKYEARAPFKHDTPLEDLRKAARYLAYAIDYLDAKSTQDKTE